MLSKQLTYTTYQRYKDQRDIIQTQNSMRRAGKQPTANSNQADQN